MRSLIATLLLVAGLVAGLATPLHAGVPEVVNDRLLPDIARFAAATRSLAETARADCRAEALRAPWNAAFDAWLPVAVIRLGPTETAAPTVAFWPDLRGFGPRALRRLLKEGDPVIADPAAYAEVSAAARGLFALETLIHGAGFEGDAACRLRATVSQDLSAQAAALEAGWRDFAPLLLAPGGAGNLTYLDRAEAERALFTQLLAAVEFAADTRLGGPLGTFERPRPRRAEARLSGRSVRNVTLTVTAVLQDARALAGTDLPQVEAAGARVLATLARLDDPAFQDVTDPQARLRIEIVQQALRGLHDALEIEIGTTMGLTPGFNSLDGD